VLFAGMMEVSDPTDAGHMSNCFQLVVMFQDAYSYLRAAMMAESPQRQIWMGIGLALLAVIVWSGNFVVARGVIEEIPPGTLAFFRWLTGTIIIIPLGWKQTRESWPAIRKSLVYLFWTALAGITLFNTLVYIGAHYSTAINLALIGTTSSPVMAIILARIFLKEKLDRYKVVGVFICLLGVLFLLARGNPAQLLQLSFNRGDGWVLLAALSFAIYNTLAKRKPAGIPPLAFLVVIFVLGTIMLIPFLVWDRIHYPPVAWDPSLFSVILYLGLGTSVISFICWNRAIRYLGAGRTALFGNLIPVFSSLEAALFLGEHFGWVHLVSMLLVFAGIVLANWKLFRQ
jgi:drug/metabolite transporter (DMT)-like permease